MSSVIGDAVSKALKDGIINAEQHGFMGNRACQTNWLSFCDEITSLADQNNRIGITDLGYVYTSELRAAQLY